MTYDGGNSDAGDGSGLTGSVERLLGSLIAEVRGLRRDIRSMESRQEAADESRRILHKEVGELRVEVSGLKGQVGGIRSEMEEDVMPVIRRVTAWENRGIGWMAAVGVFGALFGGVVATFWHRIVAAVTGG